MKDVIKLSGGARMIKTGESKTHGMYSRLEAMILPIKGESKYVVSPNTSKMLPLKTYNELVESEDIVELDIELEFDVENKELFDTIY